MQKSNIDIYHGLPVEDALGRRQPEDSRKLPPMKTPIVYCPGLETSDILDIKI